MCRGTNWTPRNPATAGGTSLANYIKNPRFGVEEIRGLYDNTAFPLNRRVKLIESAALRSACGVAR